MIRLKAARLLALGLILFILPLNGATYRSNSLGQPLELLDSPNDGSSYRYVLQVTPSTDGIVERSLLKDGIEISKTVMVSDPFDLGKMTVVETKFTEDGESESVVKTVYEEGLPLRIERTITGEEGKLIVLHDYHEGQLTETKELLDGELMRLTTYYRGDDGMLAGLRIIDLDDIARSSLFTKDGQSTVYAQSEIDEFSKISLYPGNIVVRDLWKKDQPTVESSVSFDEAGRLLVEEDVDGKLVRKTYGPDGMLLRVESTEEDGTLRTITYQYDANGQLDHSVEHVTGPQQRRIESWYRDGIVQTQTEWLEDQPVKASRFVEDGTSVVTLFEDGRPYVDITYAPDGKRVLSLEYRKER